MPCVWQSELNIEKMRNLVISRRSGKITVIGSWKHKSFFLLKTWKVSSVLGEMVMVYQLSKKVSRLRKKYIGILMCWALPPATKRRSFPSGLGERWRI